MPLLLEERYRKPLVDDKTSKKFLFLPPEIGGIWIDSLGNLETGYESTGSLPKQEVKMRRDITIVGANDSKNGALRNSRAAQEADLNWLWLIVNSRSFYYDLPLRTKPRNKDDKLCLCPFIDYFNHGNQGVRTDPISLHYIDLSSVRWPTTSKVSLSLRIEIMVSECFESEDYPKPDQRKAKKFSFLTDSMAMIFFGLIVSLQSMIETST